MGLAPVWDTGNNGGQGGGGRYLKSVTSIIIRLGCKILKWTLRYWSSSLHLASFWQWRKFMIGKSVWEWEGELTNERSNRPKWSEPTYSVKWSLDAVIVTQYFYLSYLFMAVMSIICHLLIISNIYMHVTTQLTVHSWQMEQSYYNIFVCNGISLH